MKFNVIFLMFILIWTTVQSQNKSICLSGNCKDGYGTFIWGKDSKTSGDKYVGNWQNGKCNGQGVYFFADGASYVGEFIDNTFEGYGILINPKNERYEGYWKTGQKEGIGTFYASNGTVKLGRWHKDEFAQADTSHLNRCLSGDCNDGFGIYVWSNGERYEGNWQNNKRNGKGLNYYITGAKYDGFWKDDLKDGAGTYFYSTDSPYEKYTGFFEDDAISGQGTFVFRNGDRYVGTFKNDMFDGNGTFFYTNGLKKTGKWKNDSFVGN